MLGTIEELEKEIELFQKNIAASGEMVQLLSQMLEQIKSQNEEFGSKSQTLIQRVEGLPGTIEAANNASNSVIQGNVATELGKALNGFAIEQTKYLQGLELTKQQIQTYIEQIQAQEKMTTDRIATLLTKVDGVPAAIEAENSKSNLEIRTNIITELDKAVKNFASEQVKYLQELNNTKQQISSYIEHINVAEQASIERGQELLKKVESVLNAIEAENQKNNSLILEHMKVVMEEAVHGFAKEQEGYRSDLKKTQESISKCEEILATKYGEFIESLEKMNISNLYEQNIQIKKSLDKRTLVLMILSGLSLVIGILGIFM